MAKNDTNKTAGAAAPDAKEAQADKDAQAVTTTTGATDVRVLAPVTIGGARYQPNTVLEGLPLALVEAHLGSVDPHPEAVAYARANDGAVVQYQGADHEEDEG